MRTERGGGSENELEREREPARSVAEIPAWARTLVRVLDDAVFIPGTRIGVGLDPLLGFLFPTIGDAATGLVSLALLVLGFQMRVPKVVLMRMVFNISLDTVLGAIPILGDAFDLFWRSNRRNLELIQRYERDPNRRPSVTDYLVVVLGFVLVAAAIALPILVGFALLRWLWWLFVTSATLVRSN
ncbi:MAG TPA: DUF4112 domain-containing protein [Polyangiaceae bacterium]|jgi:hypothetical protein|nr:DUF4112 domain-containing protein [Polyangiaceae bacterium]